MKTLSTLLLMLVWSVANAAADLSAVQLSILSWDRATRMSHFGKQVGCQATALKIVDHTDHESSLYAYVRCADGSEHMVPIKNDFFGTTETVTCKRMAQRGLPCERF